MTISLKWHVRPAIHMIDDLVIHTHVIALDTAEADGLSEADVYDFGRVIAKDLCGNDAAEIVAAHNATVSA